MISKRILPSALLLIGVVIGACTPDYSSAPDPMVVTTDAFEPNQMIPSEYTCDGENQRPDLEISDVPENTQSLAIIVDDPDATGGTFTHWTVWNIDPATDNIAGDDDLEDAVQGMNSAGRQEYIGPCPPSGTHQYTFTVYALSKMLDLPASSTVNELKNELTGSVLAEATLTGLYTRTGLSSSSFTSSSSLSSMMSSGGLSSSLPVSSVGSPQTEPGATINSSY